MIDTKRIVVESDPDDNIEKPVNITIESAKGGVYPWEIYKWYPSKGDKYWYIQSTGVVKEAIWDGKEYDYRREMFGNKFKTADDAELAISVIRRLLKP